MSDILQSYQSPSHYLAYRWDRHHTILILHGRWGSASSRKQVWEWLAQQWYSVIIPDLPGFGTAPLDHIFTIDDYAHWVQDFLQYISQHHTLWTLTIFGHSNGWRIVTYALTHHIVSCDTLILNNAAGIVPKPQYTIKKVLLWLWKKIYHLVPWLYKLRNLLYRSIGWHDYLEAEKNPLVKQTFLNMLATTYSDEVYRSISLPTLVLRWERDSYTPLWMGQKISSLIPNNIFVICRWQKHGIHLTDPGRVVKEIDQFIKSWYDLL